MSEPPVPPPSIPLPPVLYTERLLLRPHRSSDFDTCCALWGDAKVVRHIGGAVQESQAVWFRILRYAGMWSLLGFGMWVLEERGTGAFLGEAGLLSTCRGLPELDGMPEAGWVLGPDAWGRGFASEAMGAILGWADVDLAVPSIRCIIEDGNDASVRVAEKLGFRKFLDTVLHGAPIGVFDRASGAT
ncbi:GNAT family N-acetyltransferase [Sphingobium aromaticiconvertens]|uniref:GNAT family N-acetyltransferase n=1 Tax=Sphingobium aromaticiconvertens TaxID=365341 RepID=UPI003AFA5620